MNEKLISSLIATLSFSLPQLSSISLCLSAMESACLGWISSSLLDSVPRAVTCKAEANERHSRSETDADR